MSSEPGTETWVSTFTPMPQTLGYSDTSTMKRSVENSSKPLPTSAAAASLASPAIPDKTRVLLVDDHPLLRQGLKLVIERQSRYQVCGEADSAPRALEMVGKFKPDLAIVDITLQSADGIELTKGMRAQAPAMAILVVSQHDEEIYAERALRAGAMGYLMKHEASDKILIAVEQVLSGEIYLSDRIKGRMLQRLVHQTGPTLVSPLEKLSDRELEVLRLIGGGYGTREIANLLNLSVKTIDSYREHLKEKLSITGGSALVRFAIQWTKSQT
jgi:DNA-binding NarL/FixJ family response regulator